MQRTVFAIALFALLAIGCGGTGRFIQKGIDQYERDNYRGALHEWDDLSGSEGSMNDKGLVRYLVYRGLTHYHLGQRSYAIVFLQRGHAAYERGNALWLNPHTVQEMNAALADLQKNPRGPAPAASAVAFLASVLTTPITRAPMPLATWIVAVPSPPEAPCTRTDSPGCRCPRSCSANSAVR